MRFSIKTLLAGVLAIAVAMVVYLSLTPEVVDVEMAAATIGPLRVSVKEDGKTRIGEKYVVSAPVSGRVSRIELNAGDFVDEQTLLAVVLPSDPAILDARALAEAQARVNAAEAATQRAQSQREQAKINLELNEARFERVKRMKAADAASQTEYDIAKAELLAGRQAIETTRFDSEIAKYELDMARAAVKQFADPTSDEAMQPFEIHSPITGRVLRVIQESSAVINVGTPLIELGDPSNLEIEIDVLSTDAVRIKPGSALTVEHWGGETPLQGYVRVVEPSALTKISSLGVEEQRVNVIADFNEPPERISSLGDGYRVEAHIIVDELDAALLIPNSALFRYERDWHVFKVVGGVAVMQRVATGLQNDSQAQIVEGLTEGDRVILYPSDEITPGTPVR